MLRTVPKPSSVHVHNPHPSDDSMAVGIHDAFLPRGCIQSWASVVSVSDWLRGVLDFRIRHLPLLYLGSARIIPTRISIALRVLLIILVS